MPHAGRLRHRASVSRRGPRPRRRSIRDAHGISGRGALGASLRGRDRRYEVGACRSGLRLLARRPRGWARQGLCCLRGVAHGRRLRKPSRAHRGHGGRRSFEGQDEKGRAIRGPCCLYGAVRPLLRGASVRRQGLGHVARLGRLRACGAARARAFVRCCCRAYHDASASGLLRRARVSPLDGLRRRHRPVRCLCEARGHCGCRHA